MSLYSDEESATPTTTLELLHDYNETTTTTLIASTMLINHSNRIAPALLLESLPDLYLQV